MAKNTYDPLLDPHKTTAKMIAIRIFMHARNRSILVLKKVIAIINKTGSQQVIDNIRIELADILREIDMGTIDNPDPYFESMIRGYSLKP